MPAILDPPYRLSGTVYGVLGNHPSFFAMLGDAASQPPYNAPPKAPVLFIKPRNTLAGDGDPVQVPPDVSELEVAGGLGVVIGRTATKLSLDGAMAAIAGYLVVNDISVPHQSFHRPSIRHKARDGFCPLGPAMIPVGGVADPDALDVRTLIDGQTVQQYRTADLIRPIRQLLVDVTEFMTLHPGDVLCVGTAAPGPRVRAGQTVAVSIDGIGVLTNTFIGSEA